MEEDTYLHRSVPLKVPILNRKQIYIYIYYLYTYYIQIELLCLR